MDYVKELMDMGFSREIAEYAVRATNGNGLELAAECLLAIGDEKIPLQQESSDSSITDNVATTSRAATGSAIEVTNKLLKCHERGKLLKDPIETKARESELSNMVIAFNQLMMERGNCGAASREHVHAEIATDKAKSEPKENSDGLEPAMESLLPLGDQIIPLQQERGRSMLDNDAESGKLLNDQIESEHQAAKTGHKNCSESTEKKRPHTDEEKQRQMTRVEERLRRIRYEREQRESAEATAREADYEMPELGRQIQIVLDQLIEQGNAEAAARDRERARTENAANKANDPDKERELN